MCMHFYGASLGAICNTDSYFVQKLIVRGCWDCHIIKTRPLQCACCPWVHLQRHNMSTCVWLRALLEKIWLLGAKGFEYVLMMFIWEHPHNQISYNKCKLTRQRPCMFKSIDCTLEMEIMPSPTKVELPWYISMELLSSRLHVTINYGFGMHSLASQGWNNDLNVVGRSHLVRLCWKVTPMELGFGLMAIGMIGIIF